MKIEELTKEMLEEAKKCKTPEERMNFIKDNNIELSPDQLNGVSGGTGGTDEDPYNDGLPETTNNYCPKCGSGWVSETGKRREGWLFGWVDDVQMKCNSCKQIYWYIG